MKNGITGNPIANAKVSIGFRSTTTDIAGRFELPGIVAGSATIECISAGFVPYRATIAVTATGINHEIRMGTQEVWSFDGAAKSAVFIPAGVESLRGVIVTLGGPDTRGFADGRTPYGTPDPAGEAVLADFADSLKVLAREFRLAIFGTDQHGVSSGPATDEFIKAALLAGGAESGHPEIISAPILMLGISGGGPQSIGFAHRNPSSTIGVVVRVPDRFHNAVFAPTDAAFLQVPLLMVTGEFDTVVDVPYLKAMFHQVRGYGGLWAYAEIPGASHFTAPPQVWSLMVGWTRSILHLRLPTSVTTPLLVVPAASGWLGDNVGHEISEWSQYLGDQMTASWLPSGAVATLWRNVVVPP